MKKLCLALLAMVLLSSSCNDYHKPIGEYTYKGHHYLLFPVSNGYIPIHDTDCPNHKSDTIRILYKK